MESPISVAASALPILRLHSFHDQNGGCGLATRPAIPSPLFCSCATARPHPGAGPRPERSGIHEHAHTHGLRLQSSARGRDHLEGRECSICQWPPNSRVGDFADRLLGFGPRPRRPVSPAPPSDVSGQSAGDGSNSVVATVFPGEGKVNLPAAVMFLSRKGQ